MRIQTADATIGFVAENTQKRPLRVSQGALRHER